MGIARDVGIVDIYRYYDGAPYNGAYPIVVELKQRREKEQLLWRSKDRLRKIGIIVRMYERPYLPLHLSDGLP